MPVLALKRKMCRG